MKSFPWSWYSDPEILRLEQERIFRRSWQYAGHLGEVMEAGERFSAWAGDVPVLVVRGSDGELRAFLNVCRHRGSLLVDGAGLSATIKCPYHAWTYDLDGRLRGAPRAGEGVAVGEICLRPVQTAAWGPFVVVNPDSEAAPFEGSPGLDLSPLRFHSRVPYAVEANWKIVVENYLECYHCPVAHPGFSAVVETDPDSYRLEEHEGRWSQYCVAKEDGARGEFHLLWPGLRVNVFPGPVNVSIAGLVPDGPGRTSGFFDYFFGEDVSDEEASELIAFDDQVGGEDRRLVESVQRGVGSGLVEHGVLMPQSERLVSGFQRKVAATLSDSYTAS